MFMLKTDTRFSSELNNVLIYVGLLKSSHTARRYYICDVLILASKFCIINVSGTYKTR